MKTIEITVSPDGQTRLQTKGFVGPNCLEASRFLEEALGETLADAKTGECFTSCDEQQIVRRQQR